MNPNKLLLPAILACLAALLFFPFLGNVHLFDWDEINFAESAREMMMTGDYFRVQINFQPFWEKPPLFFWLQVLSMRLFGVGEFAARFPNAVFGVITVLTLFFLGKKLHNPAFGITWVLLYIGSLLPFLYFKSGIIDPIFNYFIFLAVVFLSKSVGANRKQGSAKNAALGGLFIGLAILTKGPVGLLILLLTFLAYFIIRKFKRPVSIPNFLLFLVIAGIVSLAWFGLETVKNGPWFLVEFIQYQIRLFTTPDAGHKQPFFYHFLVVLIGCFPLSVIAIPVFFKRIVYKATDIPDFQLFMKCLFWVVMILFTIATTKIVHYSSMCYLPLSYLAAVRLHDLIAKNYLPDRGLKILYITIGVLLGLVLMAVPLIGLFKDQLVSKYSHLVKDPFALGNLQADVSWQGWEGALGLLFIVLVFVSYKRIQKRQYNEGIGVMCLGSALILFVYTSVVVPKVEQYTQGAAIQFYESLQGKDVYVHTIGYKSYAQYFYSRKQPDINKNALNKEWLLTGAIDKPVYFVSKINRKKEMEAYADVKVIREENGFVFYLRQPD
jgi:4-amino-4-deoxy-L-arabinose transferase-like glycosyltransferase